MEDLVRAFRATTGTTALEHAGDITCVPDWLECPSELSWRSCQDENVNQEQEEEEQWLQAERS